MQPFRRVEGIVCPLDRADVDTDQIIPKQFLKRIERTGFGEFLFWDWRGEEGFTLDKPEYAGAPILVTGRNFGCGSSREHAPWALRDLGLRAVVSSQIADIFRNNALKNGLVPVVLDEDVVQQLMQRPDDELSVDVAARELRTPDGRAWNFPLDAFARECLLQGVDELGWLLARAPQIDAYESRPHGVTHDAR